MHPLFLFPLLPVIFFDFVIRVAILFRECIKATLSMLLIAQHQEEWMVPPRKFSAVIYLSLSPPPPSTLFSHFALASFHLQPTTNNKQRQPRKKKNKITQFAIHSVEHEQGNSLVSYSSIPDVKSTPKQKKGSPHTRRTGFPLNFFVVCFFFLFSKQTPINLFCCPPPPLLLCVKMEMAPQGSPCSPLSLTANASFPFDFTHHLGKQALDPPLVFSCLHITSFFVLSALITIQSLHQLSSLPLAPPPLFFPFSFFLEWCNRLSGGSRLILFSSLKREKTWQASEGRAKKNWENKIGGKGNSRRVFTFLGVLKKN